MFLIRRAAARALIAGPATSRSISTQARSITTLTGSLARPTYTHSLLVLQRRWATNDVAKEEDALTDEAIAAADAQQSTIVPEAPEAPETTSALPFDDSEVRPFKASEIPPSQTHDHLVTGRFMKNETPVTPTRELYVGNLYFDVTEEDLRREFARFGTILNVNLIKDARGFSKGFAYVEYLDQVDADSAMQALNRQQYEGRMLFVEYTKNARRTRTEHRPQNNPPSRTIYIGNMSFELSDQDLSKLFADIKNVLDVRVAIDRRTGQPRGFAHADFTDVESAELAAKKLDGMEVLGRRLRVDYSAPSSSIRER